MQEGGGRGGEAEVKIIRFSVFLCMGPRVDRIADVRSREAIGSIKREVREWVAWT